MLGGASDLTTSQQQNFGDVPLNLIARAWKKAQKRTCHAHIDVDNLRGVQFGRHVGEVEGDDEMERGDEVDSSARKLAPERKGAMASRSVLLIRVPPA
jgi:hypothetical protein